MNRVTSFSSVRGQRGDAILEALFGMVLMAIIGLGLSFASARATLSQRYLNTQNIVVSSMREQLMTSGVSTLCSSNSQSAVQVGDSSTALDLSCRKNTDAGDGRVIVSVCLGGSEDGRKHGDDHESDCGRTSVTLAADSLVTSLTLSTPANEVTKGLIGGDGKIEVKL